MLKSAFSKKKIFLLLGGVFMIVFVLSLWKTGRHERGTTSESIVNKADVLVKKMELSETRAGDVEWNLKAEKAEVYENEGIAYLQDITLEYLWPGAEEVVLTGDRGKINLSRKNIFLEGNVEASSRRIQLKTEALCWDKAKKVLLTEDAVWLKRGNIEMSGRGMVADINLGKIRLNQEIRTAIY